MAGLFIDNQGRKIENINNISTSYAVGFVACGQGPNFLVHSFDGITWIASANGASIFSSAGYAVCWNGEKFVACGIGTNTLAYSYDGITWTASANGNSIFSTGSGCGVCSKNAPTFTPPQGIDSWRNADGVSLIDIPIKVLSVPDLYLDSIKNRTSNNIMVNSQVDFQKKPMSRFCVEVLANAPSSPAIGRMYFNSADNKLYVYNGSVWKSVLLS